MEPIVHQLRGGAPDKIQLWTSGTYELKMHDNTNLVNYTAKDLCELFNKGELILPADEGDIKHANNISRDMWELGCDQSRILLPLIDYSEGYSMVIPYELYVPKDSKVYEELGLYTNIRYAEYASTDIDGFLNYIHNNESEPMAYKTATGSGSRGVLLVDPSRTHLGGKYRDYLSNSEINQFINFARKENCNILIQKLIPNKPELKKINVDFAIRDGKLLGYKWDIVNQAQQFTNWDNGYFHKSVYSDAIMDQVAWYLTHQCGITDALMNFEAFSDMESEIWMVEFNWRYSNSMFEGQALGIDLIDCYINKKYFDYPYGDRKFSRYWQCKLYDNMPNYHEGV